MPSEYRCMSTILPRSRLSRSEKLLGDLDVSAAHGVEIGALDTPIMRRPTANVKYVDHLDQEGLRSKYADDPNVQKDNIVPIDGVWGENTLADCFPGEVFDYVIASHVVEHVPNLIGWLEEVSEVLRSDGQLILAFPDKRYCFDVLRQETDLSDLIDCHLHSIRRPTPRQVFDYNANAVEFDHTTAWFHPKQRSELRHFVSRDGALLAARESLAGKYIDGHCSVFTARSLLELLDGLLELRLIRFRLGRFHVAEAGTNEMTLVLLRQPDNAETTEARGLIRRLLTDGVDSEGLPLDTVSDASTQEAEKDRRIAELEAALEGLKASSSWRITAPCRTLVDSFRSARLRRRGIAVKP